MTKVLLVGEDNPQSSEPEHALYNYPPACAGWRLQRIFGLEDETYLALDRINLCCPRWSGPESLRRAQACVVNGRPWSVIVMLGAKVRGAFARALGEHRQAIEEWSVTEVCDHGVTKLLALPHPSGRCQAWNDPRAAVRARTILRELAPEVPWGESCG